MNSKSPILIACVAAASIARSALGLGPSWNESGDAHESPLLAQRVTGPPGGVLTQISGMTSVSPTFDGVDSYLIYIDDPAGFVAATEAGSGGVANFDTRLFLFDPDGNPLLANDDFPGGAPFHSRLTGTATDGSGFALTQPGFYVLSVTGYEAAPEDSGGNALFTFGAFNEVSGPDGPGGGNPYNNWDAPAAPEAGSYTVALQGARVVSNVVYVDDSAPPGGDGGYWPSAMNGLQAAINKVASDPDFVEIRVGQGSYNPGASRSSSFLINTDMTLRGSYAGYGSPSPNTRDFDGTPSILTGDVLGDDEGMGSNSENNYQVVRVTSSADVELEGFTIERGNANGVIGTHDFAGGLRVVDANVLCRSCTFRHNNALSLGGAVAAFSAGASEDVRFARCTFHDNVAELLRGGAIDVIGPLTLTAHACEFFGNSAPLGGAIFLGPSGFQNIYNSAFSGNLALFGGALLGDGAFGNIMNITSGNNSALLFGGGVVLTNGSSMFMRNNILWGNSSYLVDFSEGSQIFIDDSSSATVSHSIIQNLVSTFDGDNLGNDPRFWDPAGDDELFGTPDDDLRLSQSSLAAMDNAWSDVLGSDPLDLDGDGNTSEPMPVDAGGLSRFINDSLAPDNGIGFNAILDRGAYEQASLFTSFTWLNEMGGDWLNSGNWLFSVIPGINQAVLFDVEGAYTVSLASPATVDRFVLGSGEVTLDLAGTGSLTLNGTRGEGLVVGFVDADEVSEGPALTINDGTVTTDRLHIARGFGTGGRVVLPDSDSSLIVTDKAVVNGSLRQSSGAAFSVGTDVTVTPFGEIESNATVVGDVRSAGVIRPGPLGGEGLMGITGDYAQRFTDPTFGEFAGTLEIDINGPTPFSEYDLLAVGGMATLGGLLRVETDVMTGYDPPVGTTFEVFSAGGFAGTFDVAEFPALSDGKFYRLSYAAGPARGSTVTIVVDSLGGDVSVGPPQSTTVSGTPVASASGDLNGDGRTDIVVAIPDVVPPNGAVVVLLADTGVGPGWSGFATSAPITVGEEPVAVTIGDFDADANPDIAVLNRDDDSVSILINNVAAPGTFLAPTSFAAGVDMGTDIEAGDFDGDMDDDLAISGVTFPDPPDDPGGTGTVVFWLSDALPLAQAARGSISFIDGSGRSITGVPISLDTGDLDFDKDLDIVACASDADSVSVLKNTLNSPTRSASLFPDEDTYLVGDGPNMVRITELDNASGPDIVTSNGGGDSVSVLLNEGLADFTGSSDLSVGDAPSAVNAIDLDSDGDNEVVVIATVGSGPTVQTLRNDLSGGQLAFAPAMDLSTGGDPLLLETGEVDGVAGDDLVAINDTTILAGLSGPSGSVALLRGSFECEGDADGNGAVNSADIAYVIFRLGSSGTPGFVDGDANGDGSVDAGDISFVIFRLGSECLGGM